MSKEITQEEAAIAWAHKKMVEACSPVNSVWCLVTPVGAAVEKCPRNQYPADVFTSDLPFRFRLAPELPAKRYRPWTPEEVPVDAWFKGENGIGFKLLYADLWSGPIVPTVANGSGAHQTLDNILKIWTHSIDNGKTWLPCGVEISS